jgi:hypothetical protein
MVAFYLFLAIFLTLLSPNSQQHNPAFPIPSAHTSTFPARKLLSHPSSSAPLTSNATPGHPFSPSRDLNNLNQLYLATTKPCYQQQELGTPSSTSKKRLDDVTGDISYTMDPTTKAPTLVATATTGPPFTVHVGLYSTSTATIHDIVDADHSPDNPSQGAKAESEELYYYAQTEFLHCNFDPQSFDPQIPDAQVRPSGQICP